MSGLRGAQHRSAQARYAPLKGCWSATLAFVAVAFKGPCQLPVAVIQADRLSFPAAAGSKSRSPGGSSGFRVCRLQKPQSWQRQQKGSLEAWSVRQPPALQAPSLLSRQGQKTQCSTTRLCIPCLEWQFQACRQQVNPKILNPLTLSPSP